MPTTTPPPIFRPQGLRLQPVDTPLQRIDALGIVVLQGREIHGQGRWSKLAWKRSMARLLLDEDGLLDRLDAGEIDQALEDRRGDHMTG